MVKSLQETQAELGELVERASRGEEVLIAVNGEVKARLTAAEHGSSESKSQQRIDTETWVKELKARRSKYPGLTAGRSMQEILDEVREDRI